ELAEGKWLREVVVRAGFQPLHTIVDRVLRGQHQHGCADAALAQRATEIESVSAGKHDVENDDVEVAEDGARASRVVVALAGDVKAVLRQSAFEHRREVRIVLDQQNAHQARGLTSFSAWPLWPWLRSPLPRLPFSSARASRATR